MTTPSDRSTRKPVGRVDWEVVEGPTGAVVHRGHREVRRSDIEVMVRPAVLFPGPGPGNGGANATKVQETGTVRLQWGRNRHGDRELTQVTFLTDVSLRLLPAPGPHSRDPRWRVRVRSGSVVGWPESGDGLQLVPRLWSTGGAAT